MEKTIERISGKNSWQPEEGDFYLCTGVDRAGRRFKVSGAWGHVSCINVWQGSFWLVRAGKRFLIQRVYN